MPKIRLATPGSRKLWPNVRYADTLTLSQHLTLSFSMNVNVIPIVTILSSTGVTVLLLLFVSFYYCMKKVSINTRGPAWLTERENAENKFQEQSSENHLPDDILNI